MALGDEKPSDSSSSDERIDRMCLRFEDAWAKSEKPSIEEYLQDASAADTANLLRELVILEGDYRWRDDDPPELDEYLQRFPEHAGVVREAFAAIKRMRRQRRIYRRGDAIGRYIVERQIGRGGFGIVYLAKDEQLDRRVAIKIPRADQSSAEGRLERATHEARMAAKLRHPGIVPIYDVGQLADDTFFVVMEYVEGKTLHEKLRQGPLSLSETIQITRQVCAAVEHAHQAGLIHRDLKPGNILIDSQGNACVTDFGLAASEQQLRDELSPAAGTLPYMAPEQLDEQTSSIDKKADIWALGVLLFEMLSGKRPFAAETDDELREQIVNAEPPPLDSALPVNVRATCLKCLAKEPGNRCQSAAQLAAEVGGEAPLPLRAAMAVAAVAAVVLGLLAFALGYFGEAPKTTEMLLRFTPTADAFVRNGRDEDTNFGRVNYVAVRSVMPAHDQRTESYLRFEVRQVQGELKKATLKLKPVFVGKEGLVNQLFAVSDDSWREESITWNNKPKLTRLVGQWSVAANEIAEIDVTQEVQRMLRDGADNAVSFVIRSNPADKLDARLKFASREGEDVKLWPELVLEGNLTNSAPVAQDDRYLVPADVEQFQVSRIDGLFSNDIDPNGNAISVMIVEDVQHGELTLDDLGAFSYRPRAGFTGEDKFIYRATDGQSESNSTIVTLRVDNFPSRTFLAEAAAYVSSGDNQDKNFAESTTLAVGYPDDQHREQALLRFDLSKISVPLTSATLQLYAEHAGGDDTVEHYIELLTNSDWDEGKITWVNRPADVGRFVGSVKVRSGKPVRIDVTRFVRETLMSSTRNTLTFRIVNHQSFVRSHLRTLYAGRHADPKRAPQLILTGAWPESPSTNVAETPRNNTKPLSGKFEVEVWPFEENEETIVSLKDAWPLRSRDQYRIQVTLSEEAYPYLLWIDSNGPVSLIYPWDYGEWTTAKAKERRGKEFTIPMNKRGFWTAHTKLPGMDSIVLLARREPLPREFDMRKILREMVDQRKIEYGQLVELSFDRNGDLLSKLDTANSSVEGAVIQNQHAIAQAVGNEFDLHYAIAFPTVRATDKDSAPQAQETLTANVDVQVKPLESTNEPPISVREAWPLTAGDQYRVVVSFNHDVYPYLLWIDSTGIVSPIYPWGDVASGFARGKEQPVKSLVVPGNGEFVTSQTTPKGMEGVVLLARRTPLPEHVDIRQIFREISNQNSVEHDGVLEFSRIGENQPELRPPDATGKVLQNQETIAEIIGKYFEVHKAIMFPTEAKP